MKDVTLNQKEQARLSVLNSVLEYQAPIAQAEGLLGKTHANPRRPTNVDPTLVSV